MNEDPPRPAASRPPRRGTFLDRLSRAVRDQNWFAVVLELLIVVVGVVVGFRVTAWGQQRDLREREAVQLAGLREDFLANRRQLTEVLGSQQLAVDRQREMLRVIHGVAPRPDRETLAELVFSTITFSRFEPVLGAYEAMLSAGDLRLIRDPALRSSLAQFAELAEVGFEDEEQITALRVRLIGYLGERGDILSVMYPSWRESMELPQSSMGMDLDALLEAHEFSSLVTAVGHGEASMLRFYGDMEQHLDAVLAGLGVSADTSAD